MYQRHGILTNLMAVVLVLTMPLCCCIVKTATGSLSTCCATEVIEVTSCCQKQNTYCVTDQNEKQNTETPCEGDCGCTIKGTFFTPEWTPPVDLIGADTPAPFFISVDVAILELGVTNAIHGPPKFNPSKLGFSSAPAIRGALILQV